MPLDPSSPRAHRPRTAAILVIGNEVLSGKIVDANSPFLLKELYGLGVRVERVVTIPDVLETVAREVRLASDSHDYVFTSGGVGPTHDDITLPAVAAAFDLELEVNQELLELLEAHYKGHITDATRRMTRLPRETQLLFGGKLSFPVALVRNVYIFPGVPEFLRAKFESIRERFRDIPYYLVRIYTRQGESVLAEHLEATLERFPSVEIGSYPRYDTPEYRVMLTLESKDPELLSRARHHLLQRLAPESLVTVDDCGAVGSAASS